LINIKIRIRINSAIQFGIPDDFWLEFLRWRRFALSECSCLHCAVIAAPRAGCRAPASRPGVNPLPATTRPEGVIASVVTSESGCGSHVAPWRLHALPGQRFNVTLVDFAHALPTGSSSACYAYAVFKEAGKSFTLCGSLAGERETVAYISTTDKLTVSVISRTDSDIPRNFLLRYSGTARRGVIKIKFAQ